MFFANVSGQPDLRFDAFDWVQYRQTGDVNSISEGYSYVYFGTESGGIIRFHSYGNHFEEPITRAQGLSGNSINAVHFDRGTGILWAASDKYLNYSFTAEDAWRSIPISDLGLNSSVSIDQIGSSEKFLWARSGTAFLKLDHSSGIMLGMFSHPDEEKISWSSGQLTAFDDPSAVLTNYAVMDGWLFTYDSFLGPFGKKVLVKTMYSGRFSDLWVGCSEGVIFRGEDQLKSLYPQTFGLANMDVQKVAGNRNFWLAGRQNNLTRGITEFSPQRNEFYPIDFDLTLNLDPQSLYEVLELEHEVWFGGRDGVSVYDKKGDFWRFYGIERGFPPGVVRAMEEGDDYVWVASSQGLARISKESKRLVGTELGEALRNHFIFDLVLENNHLWIGTEYRLFVYDLVANEMKDFRTIGNTRLIGDRIEAMFNFTALVLVDQKVVVATSAGIVSYDTKTNAWSVLAEPALYNGGQNIRTVTGYRQFLFIGTEKGITRVDTKRNMFQHYNYPFIGQVNDLYISRNRLWVGTSEGLVRFLWKKDI